jgi:hypothetical protein
MVTAEVTERQARPRRDKAMAKATGSPPARRHSRVRLRGKAKTRKRQAKETPPPKYKSARKHENKPGLHSPFLSTRLVQYLAAIWHILSPPLTEPVHSDPWLCDDWLWTSTRPSGSGFLEMPCTYRICLWSIILAPPSSRDIWINPLSIIEGANPAHVAHAHIAHARARHRRARGSAIIRLDDRAPDPGQTIPADGISLLSIIHNRAFGMGSVIQ